MSATFPLTLGERMAVVALFNVVRCALVMSGWTGAIQRCAARGLRRRSATANGRSNLKKRDAEAEEEEEEEDAAWESGEGARTARMFLIGIIAVLFLVHIWEGRPVASSSLPWLLSLSAADVVEAVRVVWRKRPSPVKDVNRMARWIQRIFIFMFCAHALTSASEATELPLVRFRFKIFLLGFGAFVSYKDIEEMAFEAGLPILILFLSPNHSSSALMSLGDRYVAILTMVTIPTILGLRGRFSRGTWGGGARLFRRGGRELTSRAGEETASTVVDALMRLVKRGQEVNIASSNETKDKRRNKMQQQQQQHYASVPSRRILNAPYAEVQATLMLLITLVAILLIFTSASNPGGFVVAGPSSAAAFGAAVARGQNIPGVLRIPEPTSRLDEQSLHPIMYHPKVWGGVFLSASLIVERVGLFDSLERRMVAFRRWEREDEAQRERSFGILSLSTFVMLGCFYLTPLFAMLGMALVGHFVATRNEGGLRRVSFGIRLLSIFIYDLDGEMGVKALVVFTASRIISTFECRPFPSILLETLQSIGIVFLAIPGPPLAHPRTLVLLIFTVASALFVGFGSQVSRFQAFELMRLTHESRSWQDHAVKQKLAGVSSAIEQCLGRFQSTSTIAIAPAADAASKRGENQRNSLRELLREAYVLARKQYDVCHLVNVAEASLKPRVDNNSNSGNVFRKREEARTWEQIGADWEARMRFSRIALDFSKFEVGAGGGEARVVLDWDLAYYLVFTFVGCGPVTPYSPSSLMRKGVGDDHFSFVDVLKVSWRYYRPNARREGEGDDDDDDDDDEREGDDEDWKRGNNKGTRNNSNDDENNECELVLKMAGGPSAWDLRATRRREVTWLMRTLGATLRRDGTLCVRGRVVFTKRAASSSPPAASARRLSRMPSANGSVSCGLPSVVEHTAFASPWGEFSSAASQSSYSPCSTAANSPNLTSSDSSATAIPVEQLPTFEESSEELPKGLTYGVLDDVSLVRLATLSFLRTAFGASAESFAIGARAQDAKEGLLRMISERQPDVLIVDFYLDYEDEETGAREMILGADVVRRCRLGGFKGAILVHSANECLREGLDYAEIDGFLSKCFNRAAYEKVMLEAVRKRREMSARDDDVMPE